MEGGSALADIPDEVREVVEQRIGDDELTILEHLADKGPTTDTTLAEALDTRTSTIRKALYKLYEERIADYEENRDPENGWLTFVWQFTPEQAMRSLEEARQAAAEEIEKEIEHTRENEIFTCPAGHGRVEFTEAMDMEFHCPQCGDSLEREDPQARIEALEEQLESLEGDRAQA